MRFCVGWWNTGLAPPKGDLKLDRIAPAAAVIERLFTEKKVDFLSLGEMSSDALKEVKRLMKRPDLAFVDRSSDGKGTKFQFSFIYDNSKLKISRSTFFTEMVAEEKKRLAQSVKVTLSDDSTFTFFIVHWPSRRSIPEDASTRATLGFALRQKMNQLLESNPNHRIIILGDFNDEPFNLSVSKMLGATRDLQRVKKRPRLLYNPFWRYFAPSSFYSLANQPNEPSVGTFYHDNGKVNRWHLFDQILVSSSLVGSDIWHLNEAETKIWDNPSDLIIPPARTVDHLPIFGVFEKEESIVVTAASN